ncbi:MAG: pitrilysin family protein [Planctomycetota bacterium]|nr:pitrilysin family protein [Planctomycetota bacterium]
MAFTHHTATLANGLQLHAEIDPAAATSAMGIFVGTGGRDEPRELMGVSHFLEHMLFKGSELRDAETVNLDFDRIGANHNAFTSIEMTAYYASCLPEHLPRATNLVCDLFRPALREADVGEERGVILEEIAMYDDDPSSVLHDAMMEHCFGPHPLGHRILGTPDTIRPMSAASLRSYFAGHYAAANTAVVAAGRLDFDAWARGVEEETQAWSIAKPARNGSGPRIATTRFQLTSQKAKRGYLMVGWPGPNRADPERFAAALLGFLYGGSSNSRLHWALVDKGIVEGVGSRHSPHRDTGYFITEAVCDPDQLPEVERIITEEASRLGGSLGDEELIRAKAKVNTGVVFAGERPTGRMKRLGTQITSHGTYQSLDDDLEKISRLTVADLRGFLDRWTPTPTCIGTMVPA